MKEILRKEYKSKRHNILNKESKDNLISETLISSSLYKNANIILCYASLAPEINTLNIINKALVDGKKVALPISQKNGTMQFYFIKDLTSLKKGMFDILEPPKTTHVTDFKNSICLVPGFTFDKLGFRLGYGKGYYDRFLKNYNGVSIGLCYEEFLREELPINEYDQKVNYICTEKYLYNCPK